MKKYLLKRPKRAIDLPWQERPTATIWVDSPEEEEDGPLCGEGDAELLERIRDHLSNSYGMRARPLHDGISPLDLAVALHGRIMLPYEAELVNDEKSTK